MNEPLHIISLGAGVQSSTMALMAAAGEITPMPHCAIFADTQAEPKSVYTWLDWLEKQLPFPVHRVTAGSLTHRITHTRTNQKTGKEYYSNMIPAFVANKDGSRGIVGRSCTTNFKIVPITQKVRAIIGPDAMRAWRRRHKEELNALLDYTKRKHEGAAFPHAYFAEAQRDPLVIQWIGISSDEKLRMKPSRDWWSKHRWPLVERSISRPSCLRWMKEHGFPEPPRSACRYCPFHSDAEWRRQRDEEPEEFAQSVLTERALQAVHASIKTEGKTQGTAFLHDSLKPLDEVDFSTDEDHGQQSLFLAECEGMCGI